jgi:lipoprotein NlpI
VKAAKLDREQHCEAFFYLAQHALLQNNKTEARRLFRQTRDTGVTNFVEYQQSAAELSRMTSEKE